MLARNRKPSAEAEVSPRPVSFTARVRSRRRTRLAMQAATALITAGFTYIAVNGLDLDTAWAGLKSSQPWWLLPAVFAFALGNLARALRWRSLFPPGRRPAAGSTLNAMMIGYFYNNILPARAGEPARILVLTQRSTSPPVEITGTVVLERIYDVVAILLIFLVAEPWLPHVSWFGTAAVVAGVLAVAIALAATLLVVYEDRPLRFVLRPLARHTRFSAERLERTVAELAHGLSGLHNLRVAIEALVWTIAGWMFSILCAYLVCVAFHLHVSFAAGVLVQVAIGLGMILPSPPAAVGVFEGAALIALRAFHIGRSIALPYAIVLHLINFIPFVLVGAALLHWNARHPRLTGEPARAPEGRAVAS